MSDTCEFSIFKLRFSKLILKCLKHFKPSEIYFKVIDAAKGLNNIAVDLIIGINENALNAMKRVTKQKFKGQYNTQI